WGPSSFSSSLFPPLLSPFPIRSSAGTIRCLTALFFFLIENAPAPRALTCHFKHTHTHTHTHTQTQKTDTDTDTHTNTANHQDHTTTHTHKNTRATMKDIKKCLVCVSVVYFFISLYKHILSVTHTHTHTHTHTQTHTHTTHTHKHTHTHTHTHTDTTRHTPL